MKINQCHTDDQMNAEQSVYRRVTAPSESPAYRMMCFCIVVSWCCSVQYGGSTQRGH